MTDPAGPTRRSVIRAGAWSVPVLAVGAAAPGAAATGPDLSHVISITGAMIITPTPATPTNFLLDFNAGATTFDASQIFSTPAGDTPWVNGQPGSANGWTLSWLATSTADVPDDPAFTSGSSVTSVTSPNADWGYDSDCTISVTANSISGYPSVTYHLQFFVTDI